MQFGLSAPFRGPMANPEDLRAIAQAAERLGFGYMTVSDHILCPRSIDAKYPYADDGEFPWTQGSALQRPRSGC
jgi:alkanesulfonate monooxygenase SsuD/methylene tetrahydromethanopterin reductase-like flavin-dependent oxidoreductase (luciferase family)